MQTSIKGRIVSAVALGILFPALRSAQIGHVVGAQKISDTAGGFTAPLDEEDQFGRSIVNLGDLDGDGVTDLLVGAHTDDDGGVDKGSVYVLFLHANGFVKSWQKISDTSGNFSGRLHPGDQFGRAAACLGDLDQDGVVDVMVSSNYDDDGGTNKGAVYVLFLNADGTVKASQKISSTQGGFPATLRIHDEFGRSITCLGDLDGDGIPDVVVGTPEDDEGGTNTGALHVLFLNRDGTVKGYHRISRGTENLRLKPGDWFGHCSANLGDFDHDGVTDLVVGSVLDDDGGVNQGSIWILLLRPDGSVKASQEINELMGGFTAQLEDIDQFGTSVTGLGDLDGDGVTDILVGAVKDDDGGMPGNADADVGAAYVLFLKPDMTVKSWTKISDTSGDLPYDLDQYDWFGSAAARLGGSPGDGLFNVAVGCRNDDDGSPNRGAIYLLQLNDGTAPVADFTANKTIGVAPLTVSFTDASQNEVTAWVWNFNEGNQSSLRNPVKTFANPGTYTIQLTARGPRGRDSVVKTDYITVVAGPLAEFAVQPDEGQAPLTVQFTDLSEGTVSAWSWDLGDGTLSSERSPVHTYAAGTYTVALTVQGPKGTHTTTHADCVRSRDLTPRAAFQSTPATGFAPLEVQFTDLSGGLVSSWSWSFGDGASSTLANPSHTFAAPGTYTVVLDVAGPFGSDSATRSVVALDRVPSAEFQAEPTAGLAPLAVHFTDLSSGEITARTWNFGDGTSSSESGPTHVYDDPGVYSVSLFLAGPSGSDVETKADLVVVVEPPPEAEFATLSGGFAPFLAEFTDQSSGDVSSYLWDFGDGQLSTDPNPEHVYALPGSYTVTLTVSGPRGTDTRSKPGAVEVVDPRPRAEFHSPQTTGVAPLAVQFSDDSSGVISSWWWEFGDGATSAEREPEHVYELPGAYDVRLTVGGPDGADEHLALGFVVVREPAPVARIGGEPVSGFAPLAVSFEDLSTGAVSARSWSFGDGASSAEASPVHVYTVPGTYAVNLVVGGPGGLDDDTREGLVTVLDPLPAADFLVSGTSGIAPHLVQFADTSTGLVTARLWSFGDGATSSEANPQHVYATPGTYTVRLTASGPAGSDLEEKVGAVTVQWPAPAPEFTAGPVSGFAPLPVAFTDLSTGNITSWLWSFGDGTTARQRYPVKNYTRTGSFTVTLTVKGPGGTRTITHGGISVVARPVLTDGGFEQDTVDAPPSGPWSVVAGTGIVVRSNLTPEAGFPRDGSRWCEIGAQGSVAATPAEAPGAAGAPPEGAAAIERTLAYRAVAPHLAFDAAFVLGDAVASVTNNDFMSVDLSDGTTSWNVFHADSFSEFPRTSALHGLPMTDVRRVKVDLQQLFPGLAEGALLSLRVSVGNGGDGEHPSFGYVDAFQLVPSATAAFRNGTGRNAVRYTSSPAVLGGEWTIRVDTTGHAGVRAIQLVGTQRPASGVMRPGGEVLVSGKKLFAQSWLALPGVNVHTISLPADFALLGQSLATQVTLTGGTAELCNAYDLVLGF